MNILDKVIGGKRLGLKDGVKLLESNEVLLLGQAASIIKEKRHPQKVTTFVIDRNINYTNVCKVGCKFCAFYKTVDSKDSYVLSDEELYQKIQETIDVGGTQILIQGGLHPQLKLDYYINMLRGIKQRFKIHIHSFSPPEIVHISEQSGLSIRKVLEKLREAGLDSLPGGGAEILDDRVRFAISPNKIPWSLWMEVMKEAHRIGMKTTATMMFGSIETLEERVKHLLRVREAQDDTGGFTAFIPWSFQPTNTELGGFTASGMEYLKTLALSRIILDNVPNIQASWVTQGAKMAQVALSFGANDFGGTMLEENVVRAAGTQNTVPLSEIIRVINDAGYVAAQRTTQYGILKYF